MNISTGGPHILLFERDQQLVALLTSELQLAGYECHAARTAVEVFDAIARYPVRLVLVNLAQAAAARREFWVALDTQRRGRGVQVLTFHCTNLAGYGPSFDDIEERSPSVLADMEVDGMLGIMNMVNNIRSRIAISNTRLAANMGHSSLPTDAERSGVSRAAEMLPGSTPAIGTQVTAPLPTLPTSYHGQASPDQSFAARLPGEQTNSPTTPSPSSPPEVSRTSTPSPTDKIRAVIYPNQRAWTTSSPRDNRDNNESGLAQLSRMLEEYRSPVLEESTQRFADRPLSPSTGQEASADAFPLSSTSINEANSRAFQESALPAWESEATQVSDDQASRKDSSSMPVERIRGDIPGQTGSKEQENQFLDEATLPLPERMGDRAPISAIPLRASPIQDMPINRASGGQSDSPSQTSTRRPGESIHSSPSLMSIAAAPGAPPPSSPSSRSTAQRKASGNQHAGEMSYSSQFILPAEPSTGENSANASEERNHSDKEWTSIEQTQSMVPADTVEVGQSQKAPDNQLLLDIVQSLPPMSSPPPQPPVHNGRATRSLGSVLLEGHLVPQNRLEVALGIQRMLSGVDMNYQLGEILLMFKLLTPDQLLAASLVSYNLITTTQISALGRIRQELHSIGLEYDLENLLILFRILTSEQLREVRASWLS